jgi:hypothetical protein
MSLKTIKVNPDLLSLAGSGNKSSSANTKTRKQKPAGVSLTQSNNVKKKLIARIKNFQQKPSSSLGGGGGTSSSLNQSERTASNSLTESIDFLNNLAREKEGKKREKKAIRRETLKHNRQPTDPSAYMSIATELPPELSLDTIKPYVPNVSAPNASPVSAPNAPNAPNVSAPNAPNVSAPNAHNVSAPAPPYSNLKKGGSKPTYRTWLRNTQKNKPLINVPAVLPTLSILDTEPEANKINENNENKNNENKNNENENENENENKNDENKEEKEENKIIVAEGANAPAQYKPSLAPKRKRITRTLKYKLGKHANGTVSVLIKNSQTRRKIQNEQSLLKQKSILDIKNYLRKNNLLKVGTQAPNDVLRHLYEQSILAGQVENKSKENLIHNYFNDEVK